MNFTPTSHSTVEDKQKFVLHFIRFVESNFNPNLFHKWFYNRMSNCRGHIAHYNKHGFYDVWFSHRAKQVEFLDLWTTQHIYGDPAYTYSDVEMYIQKWLVDHYRWVA